MRFILTLLLLCASARAVDLTITWDDDQTGVTYNVYEQVSGAWQKIGTSTAKSYVVKAITRRAHTYAVTVANTQAESQLSDLLVVPASVTNLKAVITLNVP